MLKLKQLLPVLIASLSIVTTLILFRLYLSQSATQFQQDFEKQNFSELDSINIFSLTSRLNSLSNSEQTVCIVAQRNGQIFYKNQNGNCESSWFRKAVITEGKTLHPIQIRFTIQLPSTLKIICLVFIIFQIFFLINIVLTTRLAERQALEGSTRLGWLASQLAHDIRSPLASLISIAHSAEGLNGQTRSQLEAVVNRIRGIANNLLERRKVISLETPKRNPAKLTLSDEPASTILIQNLIEMTISEISVQISNRPEIKIKSEIEYGVFALIQSNEFCRVISNLINNALEALPDGGLLKVSAASRGDQILLQIKDNGKGIPKELLSRLGSDEITYDKTGGSGLGLSHAKKTIESWLGSLNIDSELKKGTTVTVHLPKAAVPSWFALSLESSSEHTWVVIDDDPSIHDLWDEKLKGQKVLHHYAPEETISWYKKNFATVENAQYLVDYFFTGNEKTGLDLIDILGIAKHSTLVTNLSEEVLIQNRCTKTGIKIIPKNLLSAIPINSIQT